MLTSGTDSDILALVDPVRSAVSSMTQIDETNIGGTVRTILSARKSEKINEHTQGRFGLSYEVFWKEGRQKFPEDLFRSEMVAIRDISLRAEFILGGFLSDGFPMLVETDTTGHVRIREDYAIIGEGSYLAQTALIHRQITDQTEFATSLYCVFEAKKYAERVGSVSPSTTIAVLGSDKETKFISQDGLKYLESKFYKFGPQFIQRDELKIDNSHYYSS